MDALFTKIGAFLLTPIIALSALFMPHPPAVPQPATSPDAALGSGISNSFVGGKTYFLSGSGVSSSATTITLTSFKLPVSGTNIAITDFAGGTGYATIEPGNTTKQEFISFTGVTQNANGTATLTGVTRGLSPVSPYTSSATYKVTHSGGATLILSDAPGLYQKIIDYADALAIAGAPDASTLVKGLGELATQIETASSTSTGGSGPLVIAASTATSTYNSATAPLRVVVTQNSGKIDSNFVATSTLFGSGAGQGLASTTAIGSFPAFNIGKNVQIFGTSSVGTTSFAIPSGVTKLFVEVVGAGAGGRSCTGAGSGCRSRGGGGGGYSNEMVDVTGTSSVQLFVGTGGASQTAGTWSTFGTNGFYLSANGGPDGSGGCGSNGDLNICGADALQPVTPATLSTNGGASMYGTGGANNDAGTGSDARGIGGGGGGCGATASNTCSGGNGTNGSVIIRW